MRACVRVRARAACVWMLCNIKQQHACLYILLRPSSKFSFFLYFIFQKLQAFLFEKVFLLTRPVTRHERQSYQVFSQVCHVLHSYLVSWKCSGSYLFLGMPQFLYFKKKNVLLICLFMAFDGGRENVAQKVQFQWSRNRHLPAVNSRSERDLHSCEVT